MIWRNRKRIAEIVVMFCIAALTAFASIAQADDGGWGGEHYGKHQGHDFKKFAKKLSLTEAQQAQARAIFQGNKDVGQPIFTSLRAERKNLHSLMNADTIDEAAIRAQTIKIAGIQADLNVNRAKVSAQFRAILTPSQLAILKTLHEKRHNKEDVTDAPTE
jgi:protein CpxP